MLATIILDAFKKAEAEELASALDMLCSPNDHLAFSSAAIYAFWAIPDREVLYIGLAKDIAQRFRQHLGLIACDPKCCKVQPIAEYFSRNDLLGYSIIVQSSLCSPLTEEDEETIRNSIGDEAELVDDDATEIDISDVFEAEENIALAEGMLIELFEQLGDRLPKWNKIRGSEPGRKRVSFYSNYTKGRTIQGLCAGRSPEETEREINEEGPPYELLLNLEGSEVSGLNAKATIREIAGNATYCEHELLLHGIRMLMVSTRLPFEQAMRIQIVSNEFAEPRIEAMKGVRYWSRMVRLPGFSTG